MQVALLTALAPRPGWASTRIALAAHLSANDGATTPHGQAVMTSPPTVVTSSGSNPPTTTLSQRYLTSNGTAFPPAQAWSGGIKTFYTWVRFPVATMAASGGNVGDGENAAGWRVALRFTGSKLAVQTTGTSTGSYRFIVGGRYLSMTPQAVPTSSPAWIELQFAAPVVDLEIIVEGGFSDSFGGVAVAPGDVVVPSTPLWPGICLMLGDSVVEGTISGTGAKSPNDGLGTVLGERLGIARTWCSGVGGTGYLATASGAKHRLGQRLVADVGRAKAAGEVSLVIVAMGANDLGMAGIQAQAAADFDALRGLVPNAVIVVLGPWDALAPAAPQSGYAAQKAAIQAAAAGRGGFVFVDIEGIAYDHPDGVHPSEAGAVTLAHAINTRIRAALAS